MANIDRKLASIKKITEIRPIQEADAIECAIVGGGWPVVVKKGEFNVGDLALYAEIDSWIPTSLAPFLSKGKEPKEYNGIKGERLKTVKLRGQVSQGLLLPVTEALQKEFSHSFMSFEGARGLQDGDDLTEMLGIQKWEAPTPACLSGQVRGNFPSFIPKTDQERVQSIGEKLHKFSNIEFEVTEKLEGTSCTMYFYDGELNVCSRNLNLKYEDRSTYWQVAKSLGIEEKLSSPDFKSLAIQGEILGPKVQGNIYKLSKFNLLVFDVFDFSEGRYLPSNQRLQLCDKFGIDHVPVIDVRTICGLTVEDIVSMADGVSQLNANTLREGIVFKSVCGRHNFKSVSNEYLLKHGT